MKLSLQLKLGQQLTMTPQLQQAIRLLQLSTIDLQHEIQEALDSNPMLEVEEPVNDDAPSFEDADGPESALNGAKTASEQQATEAGDESSDFSADDSSWNETNIPDEPFADSTWDDIYSNTTSSAAGNSDYDDFDFESRNAGAETLQDHLNWQLNLTPMSDKDRIIAMALIDAINPDGQLVADVESIHAGLVRDMDVDEDEILAVLHRIQQFDPVGVGYRDLRECLLLQVAHLDPQPEGIGIATRIIENHLPQLASHDYNQIMKKLKISKHELQAAMDIILALNPKPGSEITPSDTTYVIPDVFVTKHNGKWKVELNPDTAPKIRINAEYSALVSRGDSSADNAFLKDSLQEARWFIKSLQSRNETLLKVARRIVEHQKGFLEYGEEAMKPLVLHDIAQAVDMHESTISRVTTQKYMHTPRGIFELKYFFSSHVSTQGGGECSSTAIRAIIKKLVAAENPQKPLSDSKITSLLSDQGINIARRTIAKYRESLSILPSNERKRLL